jgi:PAS domain S-box-containing protein
MRDRANGKSTTRPQQPAHTGRNGVSLIWPAIAAISALVAGALDLHFKLGSLLDGLLLFFAGVAAAVLAVRLAVRRTVAPQSASSCPSSLMGDLLDSAGPMVMAVGPDGRFTYVNPSTERLLGYHAQELLEMTHSREVLAPGEGLRLAQAMAELHRRAQTQSVPDDGPPAKFMKMVRNLPPSLALSSDAQLLRKNGTRIPVALHISAVRDGSGEFNGLVAMAVDQSAAQTQEQAVHESQERYRDLFENSSEMIATLSPAGQFLYANPAWMRCFGLDNEALLHLRLFEEIFGVNCRQEVRTLFRRASNGETVDRAPLRSHTADGRVLELELSLSQRQKSGNPLAVRCLLRDVTQQKQRERRLSLQLVVSQIVGESSSPEEAATRILEALCVSQGWDLALKWAVNAEEDCLEFCSAWGTPGRRTDALIQESMGLKLPSGIDLPVRAWKDGRPVWVTDLASMPSSPRIQSALRHGMVSGWAIPVRVGNKVLAVLEFYSHLCYSEDREAMAAIESVASSLGQMLARTRERGRAEGLYRQQEILLDSVADGICGVDRNGQVSFVNPAAARLMGATVAELTGRPVHELLHGAAGPDHRCSEDCPLERATAHHMATAGEDLIFRADGSSFPAEYFLTPILDLGRFSGSVLSFHDISHRYALDRLKDEFISTVSHELRTPLTSIRGALGLLSAGILGPVNDKAANLLRIALNNSDRLVRLINDILDLERIQSGREPLAFRPVQLAEIVRQSIDGMQPVAEAAGVQLIHDTTQVEVAADPDHLLQVLTNLLSNAVKFSSAGSTVSVMLHPGVSGVTVSVIDQGRGIPADKLEAIFGRFQQVDASDSRQKGGSGLGLAICRTIVLQHSGRIWAERNPVRGSTFKVFLPYAPSTTIAAQPDKFDRQPEHGTVLLADSHQATRPLIAAKLARHGYSVVQATTVEETLAAAHEGVEAILLDTSLDGMNGWEILPLLRRLDPEARTPVVLLSIESMQDPGDLPSDAQGWVAKPIEESALLAELARVLCGRGEKARILIVEDDVDLAHVIGSVFSHEKIEVELAFTRQSAQEACFAFQPHLLVLDIGLPDGDGFNVVDWLREHEGLARLPLVVYSGRELSPEERRQLTLGPTHFLTKAYVQPQQLEALVLTMLRSSRQMEEVPAD